MRPNTGVWWSTITFSPVTPGGSTRCAGRAGSSAASPGRSPPQMPSASRCSRSLASDSVGNDQVENAVMPRSARTLPGDQANPLPELLTDPPRASGRDAGLTTVTDRGTYRAAATRRSAGGGHRSSAVRLDPHAVRIVASSACWRSDRTTASEAEATARRPQPRSTTPISVRTGPNADAPPSNALDDWSPTRTTRPHRHHRTHHLNNGPPAELRVRGH